LLKISQRKKRKKGEYVEIGEYGKKSDLFSIWEFFPLFLRFDTNPFLLSQFSKAFFITTKQNEWRYA